ncbi:SPOR domain-containing protein [Hugenholtzia roseola]|uniref:SPOR domain-containing protein n=1 Tax=Hugenholtzia roseola TaxID=1002 RepID=UPI00047EBBAF|nr:SPOR domain-containing protein [Hugenholtzia roseola]
MNPNRFLFGKISLLLFFVASFSACKTTSTTTTVVSSPVENIEPLSNFRPRFEYKAAAAAQKQEVKNTAVVVPTIKTLPTLPAPTSNLEHVEALTATLSQHNATAKKEVLGYRIQLFSGTDRTEAEMIKGKAMALRNLVGNSPDLTYDQPLYRVKIGLYATRAEALSDMARVQKDYPNAILVNEALPLSKFKTKYK